MFINPSLTPPLYILFSVSPLLIDALAEPFIYTIATVIGTVLAQWLYQKYLGGSEGTPESTDTEKIKEAIDQAWQSEE